MFLYVYLCLGYFGKRFPNTGFNDLFVFFFQLTKKPITFVDVEEGYLENYLPGSPKGFQPQTGTPRYKAIASLENEACLFPIDTSNDVCLSIAAHMAVQRYIK